MMSNDLSCLMVNARWLWSQCRRIWPHVGLNWSTQNSFVLLRCPQGSSRHVTVFLGPLRSSTKEVKGPFMFDIYHGICLHATQGNQDLSHGKGKVSWFFLLPSGNWGIFSGKGRESPSKFMFFHGRQASCLVARNTSGFTLGKVSQ